MPKEWCTQCSPRIKKFSLLSQEDLLDFGEFRGALSADGLALPVRERAALELGFPVVVVGHCLEIFLVASHCDGFPSTSVSVFVLTIDSQGPQSDREYRHTVLHFRLTVRSESQPAACDLRASFLILIPFSHSLQVPFEYLQAVVAIVAHSICSSLLVYFRVGLPFLQGLVNTFSPSHSFDDVCPARNFSIRF